MLIMLCKVILPRRHVHLAIPVRAMIWTPNFIRIWIDFHGRDTPSRPTMCILGVPSMSHKAMYFMHIFHLAFTTHRGSSSPCDINSLRSPNEKVISIRAKRWIGTKKLGTGNQFTRYTERLGWPIYLTNITISFSLPPPRPPWPNKIIHDPPTSHQPPPPPPLSPLKKIITRLWSTGAENEPCFQAPGERQVDRKDPGSDIHYGNSLIS